MGPVAELMSASRERLTVARSAQVEEIGQALARTDVVGVAGEAGVGKSSLIQAALQRHPEPVIKVDLDAAATEADVSWQLLNGLAQIIVGSVDLSLLQLGDSMRPRSVDGAFMRLADRLGEELARHAVEPVPTGDEPAPAEVIPVMTEALGGRATVWMDHLETPFDLARQSVPLGEVLWALRAEQQRQPLSVLLSCREAVVGLVTGEDDAFYGDGVWLRVTRPTVAEWHEVAEGAWPDLRVEAREGRLDGVLRLTDSDPALTLAVVVQAAADPDITAQEIVTRMLVLDTGLVAETIQRARAVHRRGSQLLVRIALGIGPYQQAHGATARDISLAMQKLHRAGLVIRVGPRNWMVQNPLVAMGLRNSASPSRVVPDR